MLSAKQKAVLQYENYNKLRKAAIRKYIERIEMKILEHIDKRSANGKKDAQLFIKGNGSVITISGNFIDDLRCRVTDSEEDFDMFNSFLDCTEVMFTPDEKNLIETEIGNFLKAPQQDFQVQLSREDERIKIIVSW